MNKADKIAWKFLVEKGNIITGWSFYGSSYRNEVGSSVECRKLIKSVGIDWNKTSTVRDDMENGFEGTFCDSSTVKTMRGELVLNDGTNWEWGMSDVDPNDIFRFVCELLPDEENF